MWSYTNSQSKSDIGHHRFHFRARVSRSFFITANQQHAASLDSHTKRRNPTEPQGMNVRRLYLNERVRTDGSIIIQVISTHFKPKCQYQYQCRQPRNQTRCSIQSTGYDKRSSDVLALCVVSESSSRSDEAGGGCSISDMVMTCHRAISKLNTKSTNISCRANLPITNLKGTNMQARRNSRFPMV